MALAWPAHGRAGGLDALVNLASPEPVAPSNSVLVFGGVMSTNSLYSTLVFNLDHPTVARPTYDNYIAGITYNHDFASLWRLVKIGTEIGVADRFGHYKFCCDTIQWSSHTVHSGELWTGLRVRYEGVLLFNELRVIPSATVGFSATTNSIGRELDREVTQHGDARLLFMFGPELAFTLRHHENLELVLGEHHRSGAARWLGHMEEGYDGNTLGVRFRF